LAKDPGETTNVMANFPDRVRALKDLLERYVREGRSSPGKRQQNDGPESWPQLGWIESDWRGRIETQ